jgi:4-hydroxybenzoate polyprenyltransferase
MIKLEHTVFALPFALSGLLLAGDKLPGWATVGWTILAFAGARAAAMTLNRLIDADYDARNPRTSMRAIPAGRIDRGQAAVFSVLSFALMLFAAMHLPPICVWLSPIAIVWLSFYSFTKRFTWMCHFALGIAIAGAALGGWVAAGGTLATLAPWILALAVGAWVAGFDLIYACQDVEFDRGEQLHSLPARFGILTGLCVSTFMHIITLGCLTVLGLILPLDAIYWIGVAFVGSMLLYEHSLVKPEDLSKVNAAFFTTNGFVSIGCFVAILLDKLL